MKYIGDELELFRAAHNWKRYFARVIRPHVRGRVLDVGSGLGVNARELVNETVTSYTFLEPDATLLDRMVTQAELPHRAIEQVHGTTTDLAGRTFDTILYLDVLEHIADDTAELLRAYELLAPDGRLIILAPAFNFLYSPFDQAIGHHRRYSLKQLSTVIPIGLVPVKERYLDSLGLLLSLGNKLLMRQRMPTARQIRVWDRFVIPVSRLTDHLFKQAFGRSLVAVYRKPE